jgi:hypothetical protein
MDLKMLIAHLEYVRGHCAKSNEYMVPLVDLAIDRVRRTAGFEEALAVCQALSDYQRYFETHAEEPDRMPGNQVYSDRAMVIVRQARDVIAAAEKGNAP